MPIGRYYLNDPAAPKPNQPAHLGVNVYLEYDGKLCLEERHDCGRWGLIGGRLKRGEAETRGLARELYEETGLRFPENRFERLGLCDGDRIAAYRDGTVWRMFIVLFRAVLDEPPTLRVSSESTRLRFFTPEELKTLPVAETHRDLIAAWAAEHSRI